MATSAAPTYFLPLLKRGHEFVDGGLIHNNPCAIRHPPAICSLTKHMLAPPLLIDEAHLAHLAAVGLCFLHALALSP